MSDTVIKAENLGKKYVIGHQQQQDSYMALRDVIAESAKGIVRRLVNLTNGRSRSHGSGNKEEIWALKNVSFEVKRGEVIGVIGRNGAGKSTLLKILSRITEPTEGRVRIRGRVGSLLEVGTGFHPELTGRENIYLNGAILGMTRAEIKRKFDEIVAFAEIEKFLDTPVKRYSSGMYVRLAFAVAAHLEPEILLVDEVLAVGDADFQKKCLGKMGEVAKEGRTVLFVSHNMAAVQSLCKRALLIDSGLVISNGKTEQIVDRYLQDSEKATAASLNERTDRMGNGCLRLYNYYFLDEKGNKIDQALTGRKLFIALEYRSKDGKPLRNVHIAIGIHGKLGENLFHLSTSTSGEDFSELPPSGTIVCCIHNLPLQPGRYNFNIFATVAREIADWIQNAGIIRVVPYDLFGSGKLPPPEQGPFVVEHRWQLLLKESRDV